MDIHKLRSHLTVMVLSLVLVAPSVSATFVTPTIVKDTPTLWTGFAIQTNLAQGGLIFFKRGNWAVNLLELVNNQDHFIDINAIHRVAPHPGDRLPQHAFAGIIENPIPGGPVIDWRTMDFDPEFMVNLSIQTVFCQNHTEVSHVDCLSFRYDPIGAHQSKLSIRLEHLPQGHKSSVLTHAIPVPPTLLLVGFGLLVLRQFQ